MKKKAYLGLIALIGVIIMGLIFIMPFSGNGSNNLEVKNADFIKYDPMFSSVIYKEKGQELKSIALYGIVIGSQEIPMTDEAFTNTLLSPITPEAWINEILKDQKISIEFEGTDEIFNFRGGYVFFGKDNAFLQEELVKRGIARPSSFVGENEDYKERIRKAYQEAKDKHLGIHLTSKGDAPQAP